MTLIVQRLRDEAQMHALVVGVGGYPHLIEGAEEDTAPARNSFGLGQLSSPPISAREFTNWLITKYRNVPLGSLDLLVASKEGPAAYQKPTGQRFRNLDNPTKGALAKAIKAWKARADRHQDNVAPFFFVGMDFQPAAHCRCWPRILETLLKTNSKMLSILMP